MPPANESSKTTKIEKYRQALVEHKKTCSELVEISGDRVTVEAALKRFTDAANRIFRSWNMLHTTEDQRSTFCKLLDEWTAFVATKPMQDHLEARFHMSSALNGLFSVYLKAGDSLWCADTIADLCAGVLGSMQGSNKFAGVAIYLNWSEVSKAYDLFVCRTPRQTPCENISLRNQLLALGGGGQTVYHMREVRRFSKAFLKIWGSSHGGVNAWFANWGLELNQKLYISMIAANYGKILGFEQDHNAPPSRRQNALSHSRTRDNRFFPERRM